MRTVLAKKGISIVCTMETGVLSWRVRSETPEVGPEGRGGDGGAVLVLNVRGSPWCGCTRTVSRIVARLSATSFRVARDKLLVGVGKPVVWGADASGACGGCELWRKTSVVLGAGGFDGGPFCVCCADELCTACAESEDRMDRVQWSVLCSGGTEV